MKRTRWYDLAAITLAVAIAIGIATTSWVSMAGPAVGPPSVSDQRRGATDSRPLALFIGDSYTAGKSSAEMSYGCRAALAIGWLCALSARGGTGYISGGPANRWVDLGVGESHSFKERVSHLAAQYDPQIVLLDGGRNDTFAPREDVYAAMLSTIAEVRRAWPRSQIILIRPRFLANPSDNLGFDDHFIESLKAEPASKGVIVVDPITWLAGTDTSTLLSADGIHPNWEGENELTTSLLKSLHSWLARPVGAGL